MSAIGVGSLEALERHLDGLLGPQAAQNQSAGPGNRAPGAPAPWWLIGAGFGLGLVISGVLLALGRRSNA